MTITVVKGRVRRTFKSVLAARKFVGKSKKVSVIVTGIGHLKK
jgi:hypothetical protein